MPKQEELVCAFTVVPRTIGELWQEFEIPDSEKQYYAMTCWEVHDRLKLIWDEFQGSK